MVSWFAMATMTAELPNDSGLRAAAFGLRNAGDTLAAQASVTHGVADVIGPGVWKDDTSDRVKALLVELAGELRTGSSAMYRSADALDGLASYVGGQRGRYEETGRLLEGLARDPLGDIAHHELAEADRLIEERRAIEWNVSSAMGHASEVINQAAALATRYHGHEGKSLWSRIEHYTADFVSGLGDGTVKLVKAVGEGVFSLAVLAAKLSPERFIVDPQGYLHDADHAARTAWTTGDQIAHHKKEFVENLLDLRELKSDPVHWFGELIPNIALVVATKGASGLISKGADGVEAADATATATEAGSGLSVRDLVNQDDFDIKRYEDVPGDTGKTGGHVIKQHINTTGQSNESFIRDLVDIPNGRRVEGVWESYQTANDMIRATMASYSDKIENYLAAPMAEPLVLYARNLDSPIGLAMQVGESAARDSYVMKLIIRPSSQMPEGFIVQTAYPAYPTFP
jgi:hypothetical protein